jgi:hypothetical protein
MAGNQRKGNQGTPAHAATLLRPDYVQKISSELDSTPPTAVYTGYYVFDKPGCDTGVKMTGLAVPS